jgi:hypothetical protein
MTLSPTRAKSRNYRSEVVTLVGGQNARVRLVSHRLVPCDPKAFPELPWLLPSDVVGGFAVWNSVAQRLLAKRVAA